MRRDGGCDTDVHRGGGGEGEEEEEEIGMREEEDGKRIWGRGRRR